MNVIVEAQTFAELRARLPNLVLVRPGTCLRLPFLVRLPDR